MVFRRMKRSENKKGKLKEGLLEAALELVLTVVLSAIGIGIFALFGKSLDEIDLELALLIGVAVLIVPAALISYLLHRKRAKRENNEKGSGIAERDPVKPRQKRLF